MGETKKAFFLFLVFTALAPYYAAATGSTFLFDGNVIKKNWGENWNEREKMLWYGYIIFQVADVATTVMVLERGGYEANPMYGKHPSVERLIATKAVITWGIFSVLNDYTSRGDKEGPLFVMNLLYSLIIAHNISVAYRF